MALILAVTLAATLCSCGSNKDTEEPATEIDFSNITNNASNNTAETEPQTEMASTEAASAE